MIVIYRTMFVLDQLHCIYIQQHSLHQYSMEFLQSVHGWSIFLLNGRMKFFRRYDFIPTIDPYFLNRSVTGIVGILLSSSLIV